METKVPKAFISYSHDNPEHKKWVAELASRLTKKGVDVIFDQWDLSPGDDVPKFMEKAVSSAHRVLLICTEAYVHKADGGKGGVGYEAMIVTGELVRDLGTSKFIPVIKQAGSEILVPKSLSTRLYINLSDDKSFETEFETLLRELHQVPPREKPPLGKNPFAQKPSGEEIPIETLLREQIPNIATMDSDALKVYNVALNLARQGDIVAWRKVIRQSRQLIPSKILDWRKTADANPLKAEEDMYSLVLEGIAPYASIFAIALAGVESGRSEFNNQLSVLDDVLNPRDWNYSGRVITADFPTTTGFVYNFLHGGMCVLTNQISLAATFANTSIRLRNDSKSFPILKQHELTGWPSSLGGGDCNKSWKFIRSLPEKWVWLSELYGDISEYRSYLCAYYLLLNLLELVNDLRQGDETVLLKDDLLSLDIPLTFFSEGRESLRKGYQIILSNGTELIKIWQQAGISNAKMIKMWPRWIYQVEGWLNRSRSFGYHRYEIVHKDLMKDLNIG